MSGVFSKGNQFAITNPGRGKAGLGVLDLYGLSQLNLALDSRSLRQPAPWRLDLHRGELFRFRVVGFQFCRVSGFSKSDV